MFEGNIKNKRKRREIGKDKAKERGRRKRKGKRETAGWKEIEGRERTRRNGG